MEEKDYILFENYLSGALNAEEQQQFKIRLQNDVDFKNAFEVYKDISSHLNFEVSNEKQTTEFKNNLGSISNDYFKDKKEVKTERKIKWNWAIAASIVLLLGFFMFQQFSNPSYDDYNDFGIISLSERSENSQLIKDAEKAFNTQNYVKAAEAFKVLSGSDASNTEFKLYDAIANLEIDNFEYAETLLQEIINGTSIYTDQAQWVYALSYLKQKNYKDCKMALEAIPEHSEYYDRAKRLLDKL